MLSKELLSDLFRGQPVGLYVEGSDPPMLKIPFDAIKIEIAEDGQMMKVKITTMFDGKPRIIKETRCIKVGDSITMSVLGLAQVTASSL